MCVHARDCTVRNALDMATMARARVGHMYTENIHAHKWAMPLNREKKMGTRAPTTVKHSTPAHTLQHTYTIQ